MQATELARYRGAGTQSRWTGSMSYQLAKKGCVVLGDWKRDRDTDLFVLFITNLVTSFLLNFEFAFCSDDFY